MCSRESLRVSEVQITEAQALILQRMLKPDFYLSPYKFVMWAYKWGEGDLKEFDGPRRWQREIMEEVEGYLKQGLQQKMITGTLPDFFRLAVASGRGPGKSALVGMLAHWFISTRIGGSTWVAANGEPQLRTKTFPEIAKWVARGINAEFFEINATSIQPKKWFKEYIESPEGLGKNTRYYYANGQLWSAENPDAFAGAHNFDGELAIFDEASGIPDAIWTVQEGVFTEDIIDRFWFAFSNPRSNQGAFFDCFDKNKELWRTKQIDSRTVEGINQSTFENIIKKHGVDSDAARIEVYGQFPSTSEDQFISSLVAREAQQRTVENDPGAALIMGVDIARFGDDSSVVRFRQGRDARSIRPVRWRGASLVESANKIAALIDKFKPDAVCIDQGMGSGVIDILRSRRYKVHEVAFGSKSSSPEWGNKRVEMYALMRDWLVGAAIDLSEELFEDITKVRYQYQGSGDKIILESKDELKKRIGRSPDEGDALALTFAVPIARRDLRAAMQNRRTVVASDMDYSIFA
jgi:hypothetical protein